MGYTKEKKNILVEIAYSLESQIIVALQLNLLLHCKEFSQIPIKVSCVFKRY